MSTGQGNQLSGYLAATRSTGTSRNVEYQVFSRVTGALNRATRDGAPFAELAQAVVDNLTLWREIAVCVASDDNALPPDLRARLFYLFEFTNAHSDKVFQREAGPEPLIEINTIVMGGLRGQTPPKEAEKCPA